MIRREDAGSLGLPRRPLSAFVLGSVLAAVCVFFASSSPASAAGEEDAGGTISWSVAPSDANGPDGRSWMELELAPGSEVDEHLAIHNLSAADVVFRIDAQDGYFTDGGRFNMLPSGGESIDAGTWIEILDEVPVAAGEVVVVPFTVHVPEDATPGDHAAGIAASVQSLGTGADGTELTVESRVGFRVMTRVSGALDPALELSTVDATYHVNGNPFEPGTMDVTFVVRNTGNTRVRFVPEMSVLGVRSTSTSDAAIEMLPGDERTISATAPGVWPSFFASVAVSAQPEVIVPEGFDEAPSLAAVHTEAVVPAMPWPQLLVAAGVALLALAYLGARRRRRIELRAMLDAARQEGIRIGLDPRGISH
ncbi:COG1470 family protein [Microbacterium sp. PMB16]|uniref:COG1470 family protein n=1 Tax=Microbacterium sp. PMB16 TaxID=3120157 RepID=UPI003F4C8180